MFKCTLLVIKFKKRKKNHTKIYLNCINYPRIFKELAGTSTTDIESVEDTKSQRSVTKYCSSMLER